MLSLEVAKTSLTKQFIQHARDDYPEANDHLNESSRRVIEAMKYGNGDCWLGHINLYKETRNKPPIWQWNEETVYNFGAEFALPAFDEELQRLILERDQAPYTGTVDDKPRVQAIFDRIQAVNGILLHWS